MQGSLNQYLLRVIIFIFFICIVAVLVYPVLLVYMILLNLDPLSKFLVDIFVQAKYNYLYMYFLITIDTEAQILRAKDNHLDNIVLINEQTEDEINNLLSFFHLHLIS